MTELDKKALKKDVVQYMFLVATRNKKKLDTKFNAINPNIEAELDNDIKGLYLFILGITSFVNNKYEKAVEYFNQGIELKSVLPDILAISYMGLGFTKRSSGQLDEAVSSLTKAIELLDKEGEFFEFIPYCYQSLGEIHTTINEYEIAIDFFSKAFEAKKEDKDKSGFFRYHMGLGGCYLKMKEYDKSKFHLMKALEVTDRPPPIISRVENDLGVLFKELKDFENAEKYLLNSIKTRTENNLEDAACTSMTALAEVYLDQERISEAKNLLNSCLIIVDKYNTKWKKIEVLKLLARESRMSQNFEESVEYYEKYMELYNEIKSEQERNIFKFKNQQIENQKREISEKHEQLAATFEEIKRLKVNRKSIIFSWITIVFLVIISEVFLDPFIENYSYNTILSLAVKVLIALLFKPIDGLYEKVLWNRTLKKVEY